MKVKYFISILLSVLVITPLIAQIDRSERPEPGPAPVINIPGADQFELDNGLKVIVVEDSKLPRVSYNLKLVYDDVLEGEYKGYSSLAGQMLRNGTANMSKQEIDEAIDFIGANVSTMGRGFFASSLSRHNEALLEILSEITLNPSFPEEEFEKLKSRTLANIESQKGNASYMMGLLSSKVLYGENHPYGESQTEETIKNITVEKCKEFYNTYFKPNVAYLIVVGDVKTKEIKPLIEKYFGEWSSDVVPEHEYAEVLPPAERRVSLIDRPNAVQSSLRVGYPVNHKPNDKDRIAASVLNTLLGGGFFRLNENLREKHGFTYGAYSSLGRDELVASFTINTEVGTEVTDSAVQEILNEMYRVVLEPVSEKELQTVKNYLTGTFALKLSNPRTIANFAFEIAHYGLPEDYFVNYLKNLEAISTEDIKRVAEKYIMPENCNVMVVGKAESIADGLEKFAMDDKIHYYDKEANPIVETAAKEIPEGLTAEIVLDKYFEAIGGKKKIKKMTDFKQVSKASMMGQEITIITYQMEPNYLLSVTSMGDNVVQQQLFDGEKVVISSPMGKQEFTEGDVFEMAKLQATFNADIKYKELGIEKTLVAIETVNGKDAYKIEVSQGAENKGYEYYDADSGLQVMAVSESGTATYKDYKEFDGILFPVEIEQEAGPQTINLKVESVEVNKGLSKEDFVIEE